MSDISKISCTRSTFNPWIGCTKVGPGCDHCYAEALDARYKFGGAKHWGTGVPRHLTAAANWAKPFAWNKMAAWEREHQTLAASHAGTWSQPGFWPVFCASLADVFDNEAAQEWRERLWQTIDDTPYLEWLLVTKRIGNVPGMVPPWWLAEGFPSNVRLLITVVDQAEADRDIPKLLALPCRNGVSYEPALGLVHWARFLGCSHQEIAGDIVCLDCGYVREFDRRIDWLIIGGESSQGKNKARPFNVDWARSAIEQCRAADVPVFMKQIGSRPTNWCCSIPQGDDPESDYAKDFCDIYEASEGPQCANGCMFNSTSAGTAMAEWPEALRVQEWPR